MNNKKIVLSFLLLVLVALSLSAVSAQDAADDVAAVDDSDIDIVETDDAADVLSDTYQPETNDAAGVQAAVEKANKSGDVVDLSKFANYDLKNTTITVANSNIVIQGNIGTEINGTGDGDGIFYITGNNVTIKGIQFINTNPKNNITYGGTIEGIAIKAFGVNNFTVENCEFYNFNQDIRVQKSDDVLIKSNGFYGGIALGIVNDPTVNKETGTKALNIMGSTRITIRDNKFNGPVLDAISIASGSGSNKIINNTIVGAAYAIYFGGASTKGTVLADNEFIRCGSFKENGKNYEGLPVISIQKSSTGISITNNNFTAVENNILIAAEQGNEAHGSPTDLGDINVTENSVTLDTNVNASSVTLFHVLLREKATMDLTAPLNITGNALPDNAKGISVWVADEDGKDGVEIFSAKEGVFTDTISPISYAFNTTLTVSDITVTAGENGSLIITLKDSNGNVLVNKALSININGELKDATTNAEGIANVTVSFANAGTYYATIMFLGEGNNYKASVASAKITVNAKPTPAPAPAPAIVKKDTTLTVKKATLKVKKAKKIKVTLKSEGKAVAGKTVTIKVNKKTFKAKTNAKGVATIKVKVTKKGKHTATVSFAGDNNYKAATKKVKFTVKK